MRSKHRAWRLPLALVAVATSLGGLGLFVGTAHAIIGRPLTPLSYAGVARRTTRRAVYAGAYAHPYYGAAPYAVAPRPVVVAPAPAVYW
jgi:hypothetical protein